MCNEILNNQEQERKCDSETLSHTQNTVVLTQKSSLEMLRAELFATSYEKSNDQVPRNYDYDYIALWTQYEITKDSLINAEEVSNAAVACNKELESMNSTLMEQVKTLHETVEKLEGKLIENHKTHVKIFKSTLVHENATLKEQVNSLQDSVEKLERKLHEAHCMHEENLKWSLESDSLRLWTGVFYTDNEFKQVPLIQ
ncbi:hypothetical protein QTP86_016529, partial [Hemibagrus guttatus]